MRTPQHVVAHDHPYASAPAEAAHEEGSSPATGAGDEPSASSARSRDARPRDARPHDGRRRRRGLPVVVKTVTGLVVLTAFLTLADRWAVLYAERRTAEALKDRLDLAAAPEVEIDGFPFLTQLAGERLESTRVTVPDVAADRVSLARVSATAKDIRLDIGGPSLVRGVRVPELDGEVLLSFADLSRELGASQVTFTGDGSDLVHVRGILPVAGQDLRLYAEVTIRRNGDSGIATDIGNMSLDIGELATYRPGTGAEAGLHLTPAAADRLAREAREARALLSVPALVDRLGVPEARVDEAMDDDGALADLTGSEEFARQAMRLNLLDLALDHPEVLERLGVDPALPDALSGLTRPVLADRLSLSFELPETELGRLRLREVRVTDEGIRVRLTGRDLGVGSVGSG